MRKTWSPETTDWSIRKELPCISRRLDVEPNVTTNSRWIGFLLELCLTR